MVMKSAGYVVRALTVVALASGLFAAQAEAVPVVTITTTTPVVDVGDPIQIAIDVILAPGDEVGFWDIDVAFNNALVAAASSDIDPDDKMEVEVGQRTIFADTFFATFYDGAVDVGFPAGGEAAVEAHQGAGFRLVDLTFTATDDGLAVFALTQADIVSYDASTFTDASGAQVSVVINQPVVAPPPPPPAPAPPPPPPPPAPAPPAPAPPPPGVPEPATMLIVGSGLAAFAVRRRMRR
jgi:hypothetical protein